MSAAAGAPGLYARKVQHDFQWRLRLTHPDRAEVRVEWKGRPVVFDPVDGSWIELRRLSKKWFRKTTKTGAPSDQSQELE